MAASACSPVWRRHRRGEACGLLIRQQTRLIRRRASRPASARKPGIGDSVANVFRLRNSRRQLLDHALDQEIAEADAGQSALAVADRIEDRGVRLSRIQQRRLLVQQPLHAAGQPFHQRDLDEDQRLAGHARMEERIAAAVGVQAVLQVAPGADLVHRLVAHQLFQQRRRAVPVDPLQFQEADVEPGREQPAQIGLQRRQQLVVASNFSRKPRRSTRNFRPSGMVVNWVSSRSRGGSSARRSAALAVARSAGSSAACTSA